MSPSYESAHHSSAMHAGVGSSVYSHQNINNTQTRAGVLSSQPFQARSAPPMISYDPNISDDDDEDEYDEPTPGKGTKGAAIKKRKSAGSLKGNADSNKKSSNDEDESEVKSGSTRRKITIEYIQDRPKRHTTFSKRKSGIMKKVRFIRLFSPMTK